MSREDDERWCTVCGRSDYVCNCDIGPFLNDPDGSGEAMFDEDSMPTPCQACGRSQNWERDGRLVYGINDDDTSIYFVDPANARLIAAAPDLLEALRDAERWMTEHGCSHEYPVLRNARAAIRKATAD